LIRLPSKPKLEGEGEARAIAALSATRPDLVVLAGFMRVLKPGFLNVFCRKSDQSAPQPAAQFLRVWTGSDKRSDAASKSPAARFIS
jgi:hypothetical protein